MKLSRVAQRFNDTPCNDSYTGEFLFHGQLGVYTEAVRDGITTQRRVLELAPNTELPDRKVVEFEGVHWIIGEGNIDTWKGKTVREKFAIQKSVGLANVATPLQFLNEEDGLLAHAGIVYVKTNKETEISSGEFIQSTMFLARSETVTSGQLVELDGRTYIAKESYLAAAGHLGVVVEELQTPIRDEAATKGKYNPITEEYEDGPTIKVVRLRWQSDFEYFSLMTPTFERGDMRAITLQEPKLKNGDKLNLSDGEWIVINREGKGETQHLHLRRSA